MEDLGSVNPGITFDGSTSLASTAVANPCGLIAKYVFTDRYNLTDTDGNQIAIDETNIAHSVDIDFKFKAPEKAGEIQWYDVTDGKIKFLNFGIEHLMVWY